MFLPPKYELNCLLAKNNILLFRKSNSPILGIFCLFVCFLQFFINSSPHPQSTFYKVQKMWNTSLKMSLSPGRQCLILLSLLTRSRTGMRCRFTCFLLLVSRVQWWERTGWKSGDLGPCSGSVASSDFGQICLDLFPHLQNE